MSGWTLDPRAKQPSSSKPRRAFFDSDDDYEKSPAVETSASAVSRRAQRSSRCEFVVDTSDDDPSGKHDHVAPTPTPCTQPTHTDAGSARGSRASQRRAVAVRNEYGSGKSDELAMADVVRRPSDETAEAAGRRGLYVEWLVRDFLQRTYPRAVLDVFDQERRLAAVGHGQAVDLQHQFLHRQLLGAAATTTATATAVEALLVAWDAHVHHRLSATASSSAASASASASASSTSNTKSSSGLRKKPQLRVAIASDVAEPTTSGSSSDEVDYNRLDHPGHTPKAQQHALLAAVMGAPGSTPKANAGELLALGFEDVEDMTEQPLSRTRTQLIPSNAAEQEQDQDEKEEELSLYAKRKRAARRHDKHVFIGEQGHTPTKEYVFFRETPPRFVTETVESAEQILRSLGGNPDATRQSTTAATLERFVELQSSDVAKYTVGQRVDNLGAQRNVTGLVSKLYGSRLCGTAGPGTVVIDTWMGSDTAPHCDGEQWIDEQRLD